MSIRTANFFSFAIVVLAGCSDSAVRAYGDDDGADYESPGEYAGDDDDDGDGAAGDTDDSEPPPDEEEEDSFLTQPRGTDEYVLIANPLRDTVSKIHAFTRSIETIEVGDEPVRVLVSPDYQRGVSFNQGDDSVSVIQLGTNSVTNIGVREDMNWMEMSPDGRWVICWFNASAEGADTSVSGVRSYTEVSFVDTLSHTAQSYSVGFNPEGVRFSADSRRVVIYSDGFLTVADLMADPIELELIDLGEDPVTPDNATSLELVGDASWAYVLYPAADKLKAIDLDDATINLLDAGLSPQDIDITPEGKLVAVARDSQEVRIWDAADPLAGTERIIPTPVDYHLGQLLLTPDGSTGLLFTTAYQENQVTVWDIATDTLTVRGLVKPIDNISIGPDGRSALVLHTLEDAPDGNPLFDGRYALTVVDLETWITNPVLLQSRPKSWATSEDGRFSLFVMDNNRQVGIVDYNTRLVDDVTVPSVPVFVGVMPNDGAPEDALGWVSQEHDLGRISFVRPADGNVQTVTGFELNAGIE